MPDDSAKRFGRSASLDTAAAEGAGLRVENKKEGVACPPWWLPSFMADSGGNQEAHVDVGKPMHRDLTRHQPAEQLTPDNRPSHALPSSEPFDPVRPLSFIAKGCETIAWWTSSALLCALLFLLSADAFNGKVSTYLRAACPFLPLAAFTPRQPLPLPHCPNLNLFRIPRRSGRCGAWGYHAKLGARRCGRSGEDAPLTNPNTDTLFLGHASRAATGLLPPTSSMR